MLILCSMMLIASKIYCKLTMPIPSTPLSLRLAKTPAQKLAPSLSLIYRPKIYFLPSESIPKSE